MSSSPKKSCCCGCSLETVVKTIGWVGLVCEVVFVVQIYGSIYEETQEDRDILITDQNWLKYIIELDWLAVFFIIAVPIFHIILLLGVHLKITKFIFASIIMVRVGIALAVVGFIIACLTGNIWIIILASLVIGYQTHIHSLIDKFYQTMDKNDGEALIPEE